MPKSFALTRILIMGLFGLLATANGDVAVLPIFSNHAVLQKSPSTPIWGKATPGERVTVTLDGSRAEADAGADGKWRVVLDLSKKDKGPFELVIEGKNKLVISDVLVGDVWLCSGQSNMERELRDSEGAKEEIAVSANPCLRQFLVKHKFKAEPQEEMEGEWTEAGPGSSASFTAVGYYFGKTIQKETGIPIGLIKSACGNSTVEAWMSDDALNENPDLKANKDRIKEEVATFPKRLEQFASDFVAWQQEYHRQDPGTPDTKAWTAPDVNTSDWKPVNFPVTFKNSGLPDAGIVWLRHTVVVPAGAAEHPERALNLGLIRGIEEVYWNGEKIGECKLGSGRLSEWRYYDIPKRLFREGEAVLSVRVFCPAGGGAEACRGNGRIGQFIELKGPWLAKAECEMPPLDPAAAAKCPRIPEHRYGSITPTYLYNGKIHPLVSYGIKGALWYQGETNAANSWQYRTAFPLLIRDWRSKWGQGNFPFYFCQLPNFGAKDEIPADYALAIMRESQSLALTEPNTAMAVLIDVGEANEIHPRNKKDVGDRLARIALARDYGRSIVAFGPQFQSLKVEGDKARVSFSNVGKCLKAKTLPDTYVVRAVASETKPLKILSPGSELQGFAICGVDRKWKWAQARIEKNDTVLVWSPEVQVPVAVRYAWAGNPTCNLYNDVDLPAVPFRTDSFSPQPTQDVK